MSLTQKEQAELIEQLEASDKRLLSLGRKVKELKGNSVEVMGLGALGGAAVSLGNFVYPGAIVEDVAGMGFDIDGGDAAAVGIGIYASRKNATQKEMTFAAGAMGHAAGRIMDSLFGTLSAFNVGGK